MSILCGLRRLASEHLSLFLGHACACMCIRLGITLTGIPGVTLAIPLYLYLGYTLENQEVHVHNIIATLYVHVQCIYNVP